MSVFSHINGNMRSYKKLASIAAAAALLAAAAIGTPRFSSTSSPLAEQFSVPPAYAAAVDYFLKIEGIEGESTAEGHKGEIDIESWSWGENQPGLEQMGSAGGGGGAGKVSVHDIHFTKSVDKSTPVLMQQCATGQHYPRAVLTVRKAGADRQVEYFKITLSDVMITTYQVGGSQGTVPTDSFSLNFSKIEFEYVPQKPDGSLDAPVKAGYDVKANKKV